MASSHALQVLNGVRFPDCLLSTLSRFDTNNIGHVQRLSR